MSGVIEDRFEKKGRQFLVAAIEIHEGTRPLQTIRHTAIHHLSGIHPEARGTVP